MLMFVVLQQNAFAEPLRALKMYAKQSALILRELWREKGEVVKMFEAVVGYFSSTLGFASDQV